MTDSAVVDAVESSLSFGDEFLSEEPSILARVVIDRTEPSDRAKSGKRWVYTIKPLDFETKGDGLSSYVNLPVPSTVKIRQPDGSFKLVTGYSKKSGVYLVLEAFRRTFFAKATKDDLKALMAGEGALIDLVGWFQRSEIDFGPDGNGGRIKATYFLPKYPATAEEIAAAGHDAGAVQAHMPTSAAVEVSPELAEEMLDFMSRYGTRAEYTRKAFRADLSQEAKDLISGGRAAQILVERGLAVEGDDGRIDRA